MLYEVITQASRDAYQARLLAAGHGPITSEIADAREFYYAEDYHQQYLAKNPRRITSYNVCYMKLLRLELPAVDPGLELLGEDCELLLGCVEAREGAGAELAHDERLLDTDLEADARQVLELDAPGLVHRDRRPLAEHRRVVPTQVLVHRRHVDDLTERVVDAKLPGLGTRSERRRDPVRQERGA